MSTRTAARWVNDARSVSFAGSDVANGISQQQLLKYRVAGGDVDALFVTTSRRKVKIARGGRSRRTLAIPMGAHESRVSRLKNTSMYPFRFQGGMKRQQKTLSSMVELVPNIEYAQRGRIIEFVWCFCQSSSVQTGISGREWTVFSPDTWAAIIAILAGMGKKKGRIRSSPHPSVRSPTGVARSSPLNWFATKVCGLRRRGRTDLRSGSEESRPRVDSRTPVFGGIPRSYSSQKNKKTNQ